MILAAGRGQRMKPLTDHCPKPLLRVADKPLIEHHLIRLKAAGIVDIVINHAWLGEQIEQYFGNGQHWGVRISYSAEGDAALETAGGIVKALEFLGSEPFLVVNGDIFCDYDFKKLPILSTETLAHLILVPNPQHNPDGDFTITGQYLQTEGKTSKYTYSGIGVYDPKLFSDLAIEKAPLAPILTRAMQKHLIVGSLYQGIWSDVGTPQRLKQINKQVTGH